MIFLVDSKSRVVIKRFDAWQKDSYKMAIKYIKDNGGKYISERITLNGDMIIEMEK